MAKGSTSSADSLSPSSTASLAMAAPTSVQSPAFGSRQRKKPGPKPKAKTQQKPLIVVLKVTPDTLRKFDPESPAETTAAIAVGGGASTPAESTASVVTSPQLSAEGAFESTSTAVSPQKRKGVPGPKPGSKRARVPGAPPGKPGRKKAKLDPNLPSTPNGAALGIKLGPKANTGAINDKLRALDRSGTPCKRWTKAGIKLKSFTGVQWEIPTWAAPKSHNINTADNSTNPSVEPSIAANTPPPDTQVQNGSLQSTMPELSLPPPIAV